MFLTPKQETKPWYLHAFAACCSHFLLPVSTAIPSHENEAYDAKIVLIVEKRLLISSIRKILVPAEIQVTPYVHKLISPRGGRKGYCRSHLLQRYYYCCRCSVIII
jgi:hypothetical protein